MTPPQDPAPMQAAWVIADNPVDYDKARKRALRRLYVDIREQYDPAGRCHDIRQRGFTAGVYWGARWGEEMMSPEAHARQIHEMLKEFEAEWAKGKQSLQCEFQMDYEDHDPAWILAWLKAFRAVRPLKRLTWTLEAHQGGWFTPELVKAINSDPNLIVVPQLYNGAMEPVGVSMDGLDAVLDLVFYGVDPFRIQGFYDAREVPLWWRGFLFTLETA